MNFFGRTEAVEKAFSEWKYAGNPLCGERSVRYAVDASAFGRETHDDDSEMDPLEISYYILYPGDVPDSSLKELPRWNHDGGFWEGSDDIWEYCLIGDTREHADALFRAYLPENASMFDEACVIRFADEESFIDYLKCEALGYRGNHRSDSYPSENMPLHHTPGSPLSYRMAGWDEKDRLPAGENIGIYAFCRTPEEAEEIEAFCEAERDRHHFGGVVISDDQPETFRKFLVPVYDDDIEIERTLHCIQNNYIAEQGFVPEHYPAGIHIARTAEGKGLFDAREGIWIFPHLSEDLFTVSGEDDGYITDVQESGKGLIRIMGDSRLRKIVAALLVPCEYDAIVWENGEILCVRDGKTHRYDRERDRVTDV